MSELEKITWNKEGFFLNKESKKVTPTPKGNPTQISGPKDQELEELKEIINSYGYKGLGINAYSLGTASINGLYSTIVQFHKI